MKHKCKVGNCINDKDTKFIKKLLKKKPISVLGRFSKDNDCTITVSNIRKYELSPFRSTDSKKFCYEIDVIVKLDLDIYYRMGSRRKNDRIRRYVNERELREELAYFNILDLQISKVTFEK